MRSPSRECWSWSDLAQVLELHKRLHAAEASAADGELLQRQIAATDRAIDRLVYELCSLTEDEIRIVEGGV